MATKRKVEIFSAGCVVCEGVIEMVERAAGPSDEVIVNDMKDSNIARRAISFGIRSVPSVVIDGKLLDTSRGVDEQVLREAGLGRA
jgi:glutaredoxin